MSGWRYSALSSKFILASSANSRPSVVVMKGLISTSEASVSSAARASAIMNFTAPLMYFGSSPSLNAILRAW